MDPAMWLEYTLRQIYVVTRYGVGGVANVDTIRRHPYLAISMCLAPFFYMGIATREMSNFIDHHMSDINPNALDLITEVKPIIEANIDRLYRCKTRRKKRLDGQ